MILRYIDLQNEIARGAGLNLTVADNLIKIKLACNIAYGKLAIRVPSPSRQRVLTFQTVAEVSDGTASVVEGSRTVVISGATPVSSHVGRFFSLKSQATVSEVYEILSVSGQNYTLRDPYIGATDTSAQYKVFARYYDLPSAVEEVMLVKNPSGVWMSPLSFTEFQRRGYEGFFLANKPSVFALFSNPATIDTYTIAAVATTAGSFDITAASGFLGVAEPGDRILNWNGTTDDYEVNSVDSDTTLTLYQRAITTVASATATFERRRSARLWINPPADKIYPIEYSCLVKIPDMVHDNDEPFMLPRERQKHIIPSALFELGRYTQSTRRAEWAKEQAEGIEEIDDSVEDPVATWL